MDKQSGSLFLIMLGLLLSLGAGCSNALVGDIATTQAESFNALQQEVTGLATAQAESFDSSHEAIVSVATVQVEQFSALQEDETDIATAQAETFSALQDVAASQTELMDEVQRDVHVVATAIASQEEVPLPAILESLAMGVGLLWQREGSDDNIPLDFAAAQSLTFDRVNDLLNEWAQKGTVLFIWQQTSSTNPDNSLNEVRGTLYHAETLLSDNLTATDASGIQLVGLQNVLFLTSGDSEPVALVRSAPQEIIETKPLQQTATLQTALMESEIPQNELNHLLILLDSSEETSGDGQSQLVLLVLEANITGPDPGDPNCGLYCARCFNGICQPVCWACRLFQ